LLFTFACHANLLADIERYLCQTTSYGMNHRIVQFFGYGITLR